MAFRTNKTPVLQTKSASGSVATFNTALAMPLSSCNIAVNAWQEGSGDPSPVNNRPIHGFSEVNATRAGKNLFDYRSVTWEDGYLDDNQEYHSSTVTHYSSPFPIIPNVTLTASGFNENYVSNIYMLDKNKNWLGRLTSRYTKEHHFTTPQNCYYLQIQCAKISDGSTIQLEAGSTATAYEPYVTPTIYTIQLGQEVYGAEVDVVNGVAHCTHSIIDMGNINWSYVTTYENPYFVRFINGRKNGTPIEIPIYKYVGIRASVTAGRMNNYECSTHGTDNSIYIRDDRYTSASDYKTAMAGTYILYELATPIEIQLEPTLIETFNGSNNIFCDTGDTSVTYKDLDIAKRGNFREVFKLPS